MPLMLTLGWFGQTAPANAEPAEFVFDPEHTSITFFTHHLGLADIAGRFLEAEGPVLDRHDAIGIDASGTIRRSEFGMTWGEGRVGEEIRIVTASRRSVRSSGEAPCAVVDPEQV